MTEGTGATASTTEPTGSTHQLQHTNSKLRLLEQRTNRRCNCG